MMRLLVIDTSGPVCGVAVIEDGKVRVSEADCLGGDCTRFAPAASSGSVILCLPHHLSVTVEGGEEGPDVVVR